MKISERLEDLQRQVNALEGDELWQRWLKTRRVTRRRSLRNQILIAVQRPDTIRAEGYTVWREKFHRQVAKGSKAIWILAPTPFQVETTDEATGENVVQKRLRFKPVTVFAYEDTEQIEGRPTVPVEPPVENVQGDSHAEMYDPLVRAALDAGITGVEKLDLGQPRGCYMPKTRGIKIHSDCAPNEAVAVLVHELAHHLVRKLIEASEQPDTYAQEEVLVEATTYCVCSGLGLDVGDYASRYCAAWGAERVQALASLVDRLASAIETGLEAHVETREEVPTT